MLYQLSASCPIYDAILDKYISDPHPDTAFYEYHSQMKNIYAYLTEHTGKV